MNPPVLDQRPKKMPGEVRCGEAAAAVARLRPGVREVDVVGRDRGVGHQPPDDAARVARYDPDVGQPACRGDARQRLGPTGIVLDAEEVGAGPCGRGGQERFPPSGPDLHLDGAIVPEDGGPVDGCEIVDPVPS